MREASRGERSAAAASAQGAAGDTPTPTLPEQPARRLAGTVPGQAPGTVHRFLLFSAAGVLAALAHYGLMAALMVMLGMAPVLASSFGVVLATIVAFLFNHRVTFADADGGWRDNGLRWTLVAGGVWTTNGAALKLLLVLGVGVIIAQLAASLLSFVFSFVVNRRFTFRL